MGNNDRCLQKILVKALSIRGSIFSALDSIFGGNTRSKFGMRMRPIQRDGGQRLESYSGNIFFDLREARYDAFAIDKRLLP